MNQVVLIMAGGKGERFWPKSRANYPKQFLSLTEDGKTMLQLTIERISPIISYNNIFISTNVNYKNIIIEQIPDFPEENILLEPMPKDTSACIAFASVVIQNKIKADAVVYVLSADHLIKNNKLFLDTLLKGYKIAEMDRNIVTIGITPSYPETGYGYIQFEWNGKQEDGIYPVHRFVEKPDLKTAKSYLQSGQYLWNSGIFIWKISTILYNFKQFLPEIYSGVQKISSALETPNYSEIAEREFSKFPKLSIDFGIMEKAEDVYTIPGNFGWDDVGSWLALERINQTNDEGNIIQGDVLTISSENVIISGGSRLVAVLGMKDMVVVDSDDALLICAKNSTQNIKKVTEYLRIANRHDLI